MSGLPALREHLLSLQGTTIPTLSSGAPNRIVEVADDHVIVATDRSPEGSRVPLADVERAYERLEREGELYISVDSVGHRSSFIGALLATLPGATSATNPRRIQLDADSRAVGGAPPGSRPAGWLFQANPDLWDLEGALRETARLRWLVRQHAKRIGPGDPVFMWVSGRDAGIVATAIVRTTPAQLDGPRERPVQEILGQV